MTIQGNQDPFLSNNKMICLYLLRKIELFQEKSYMSKTNLIQITILSVCKVLTMYKHKQLRLQETCISNLGFLLLQHIKRLVSFHITCYRVSPHDDFIMVTYSDNFFVSASFVVIFLSLSLTMKCKVINHDGLKCVFTDCPDGTFGPNCIHIWQTMYFGM